MADLGALFNPQAPQPPGQNPGQDIYSSLFSDPRTVGALLSVAGALAQPPQFGQSGLGHVLGAVGSGGESVRTQEALDLKQQEADSKGQLREAQAGQAEARARTAGAGADTAAARLELTRQGLDLRDQRARTNALLKHTLGYQAMVDKLQKQNSDRALLGQPLQPIPTPREWNAKFPEMSSALGLDQPVAGGDTTDETTPVAPLNPQNVPTATGPGGKKLYYRDGKWQDQ